MEQDSRASESRERAASSEPSSTRPNPFDDGDCARKRRRTSLTGSGSRSRSVESLTSQEQDGSDAVMMKVDAPDPAIPSTPPQPEPRVDAPPTEPHSSKVTLNLRNADSLEATPASPTPARPHKDEVKVSIEGPEMDMAQAPLADDDVSSSSSGLNGSENLAVITIDDDDDDDLELAGGRDPISMISGGANMDINIIMLDFPYHAAEETLYDTVARLIQFFDQPAQYEDVLILMREWLEKFLLCAEYTPHPVALESFMENRAFWQSLPQLFWQIYTRKVQLVKGRIMREVSGLFFTQVVKLSAYFVDLDYRTLQQLSVNQDSTDLELLAGPFLTCLCSIARKEELQLFNAFDTIPELSEVIPMLQGSIGGSMAKLNRTAELQTSLLSRFPRKTMENLVPLCNVANSIARESAQSLAYQSPESDAGLVTRAQKNLALGLRLFKIASDAVAVVVDKFVNHLSGDAASHLLTSLTQLLGAGLQAKHQDALALIEEHQKVHPNIPKQFTTEAIANEWRFGVLSKLIRSRQMQLRVVSVGILCQDLVGLWKRYSDAGDDAQHLEYLHYISHFLTSTQLVDYIFGPTCHPEITQESSNIIGFLMVTRTYSAAHTDLFWQTVTSSQDPRVAEAVARMLTKILNLMTPENLSYLCEKLCSLPIDAFVPYMRDLFDSLIKNMHLRVGLNAIPRPILPYRLCVRLLQQSSVYGSQGTIAYQDIHNFAAGKLKELLHYPSPPIRGDLRQNCVNDIAAKTTTTPGSIHALSMLLRPSLPQGLAELIQHHDFTRLLVDELEATIAIARKVGFSPVYAAAIGTARRELLLQTIATHDDTLDSELGRRLWDLLVGTGAACQEDRNLAWQSLNTAVKEQGFSNSFLNTCLREYLPDLPPTFYCEGSLEFVRAALAPLLTEVNRFLDEEDAVATGAIELLWQMILTAPNQSIELQAIQTLVHDIYVESKAILTFPVTRARNIHFGLVNRCLQQMEAAAQQLRSFNSETPCEDGESMVIVPTDAQRREEELKFIRSLTVLRVFLKALQGKYNFAAPDLRPMMPQSPSAVEGESAEIKYQSFDGDKQTEVKLLAIGRKNTAASLLASLRDATGFDNYRIFYRGAPLIPSEDQICKPLEDLEIHDGLILVKKEEDVASSPVKVKPGASKLEIEILSHFKALWEYLSMDERLAGEIYQFLVRLPAHESIQTAFENDSASYSDLFPLGQPFKSLYAIHALREYLSTRRLKSQVMQVGTQPVESQSVSAQEMALQKAMSLLVAAICDPEVVGRCSNQNLQVLLSFHLVDNFVQLLQESISTTSMAPIFTPIFQNRLLAILASAAAAHSTPYSLELISRSFEALLEGCARNPEFWAIFTQQSSVKRTVQDLLLTDNRHIVRTTVSKLIASKSFFSQGSMAVSTLEFAEYFWPVVFEILPRAVEEPSKCEEVFNLGFALLKHLAEANSTALDLPTCLAQCGRYLLLHSTAEDISHPDRIDTISHGLISILNYGIKYAQSKNQPVQFPANFTRRLVHKHLFPVEDEDGPLVPQVLLSSTSRNMLCEIVLTLLKDGPNQTSGLLQDLFELTPYIPGVADDPYKYELPQLFDRTKAIRSPCGYPGLRNLSNTCYLNSLFTQLFMNTEFRRFILQSPSPNPDTHQLLYETRALFAALQDSVRRFVDPLHCVGQIMTYDETPIDIHNQMDVDEFYNLLFDRWEAQLSSESAKKALRSIYGGQLVQQVKSKECEHISERVEPFSAIQCDIKGKAGLEESLQAYVDGEIMEGDNKYKCETCDRHVDAVKRACLKDIPDHLIFHLKRFDFNLRTLQRSKINDHFAFPNKIDMQPYTIDHLSDTSTVAESDEFELVGVLVHSGTAESGHYYSFIRERPSTGSSESWVEFNDDVVNAWDPSLKESACYGGPDYRPPYDTSGMYEKVYSAYMLFYQRSSSLKREQGLLLQSGKPSPLRFDLPTDLELPVKSDNWALVQRHCLNDPTHIPFVNRVLSNVWASECSEAHKSENLAMYVALGHLDQVASRAKDTPDFDGLYRLLVQVCQRCSLCCFSLFNYLKDHGEALRMLLQRNADQAIRQEVGELFIFALSSIKDNYPAEYGIPEVDGDLSSSAASQGRTVLGGAVTMFERLWSTFHTSLRAWPEYFGTMADFAQLGKHEAAGLLAKDFLFKVLMIITADASLDLPPQYARMIMTVNRRLATRAPSYENIIALIDILMGFMDAKIDAMRVSESLSDRLEVALRGEMIPYTAGEINLIHRDWARNQGNLFVDKLLQINQNHIATDSIITRLMEFSPLMDNKVLATLRSGITGQLVAQPVAPYLRAAISYVRNSCNADNVDRLVTHVADQCWNMQGAEGRCFLDFLKEIFDSSRQTADFDAVEVQSLTLLPRWVPGLLGYIDRNVSSAVESFLKEKLFDHGAVPDFGDADPGDRRSRAMTSAGRHLAIACLTYLQDTYVSRGLQAPRDTVSPLDRVIKQCSPYYQIDSLEDGLDARYMELSQEVLEPISRLTVDEIEDDGSEWDNSVGSSEQMDSLADLSTQAVGDINDGDIQ